MTAKNTAAVATETRTIEVWGTKTFKKYIDVSQAEYDAIAAAGRDGNNDAIAEIIHDRNDWSDTGVKLKHIKVDLFDENDKLIADDMELL